VLYLSWCGNFPLDYKIWVINTWSFVMFCSFFFKPKQEKISKLTMKSSNHNRFLLLYPTRVSIAQIFIVVLQHTVTLDYHVFILRRLDPSPTEALGDIFPTDFNCLPSGPWFQRISGNLLFSVLIRWWES